MLSLAAAAFWFFGDEILKSYRPNIELQLSELIGGKVTFSSIRATIIPSLDLYLKDVKVTPNNTCGSIEIDSVSLNLDLLALLSRKLEIDRIGIKHPRISLAEQDGTIILVSRDNSKCSPPENPTREPLKVQDLSAVPDNTEPLPKIGFKLNELKIRDGEIAFSVKGKPHELKIDYISAAARLEDKLLKLDNPSIRGSIERIPFKIDAGAIEADLDKRALEFERLRASINNQRLLLSGKVKDGGFPMEVKLEAQHLSLPTMSSILSTFSPKYNLIKKGELSGAISFSKSDPKAWDLNGSLSVQGLNVPTYQLDLGEFKIESLQVHSGQNSLDGRAKIAAAKFGIHNDMESYGAETLTGSLSVAKMDVSDLVVKGQLAVGDFSFSDNETKLDHVTASLDEIKSGVRDSGDVEVHFLLNSTQVKLAHPEVKISSVRKVSAPISVMVPRKGGYSVAGVVAIEGSDLATNDMAFSDLTGSVDMVVSGALKSFKTTGINGMSQSRAITIATDFSMKHDGYKWADTSVRVGEGVLKADLSLARGENREYSGKIEATDLGVGDLLSIVRQKEEDKYSGRVKSLSASVTGNFKDPLGSMIGSGQFTFADPLLKNYNLTQNIGAAIAKIPLVGTVLVPSSNDEDRAQNAAEGSFSIAGRAAKFEKFTIRKNRYTVEGDGDLGFDLSINAEASVIFLRDTFSSLGMGFDALGNLIGRAGRISIPIFLKGKLPEPSVVPDIETFVKDNSGITLVGSVLDKTAQIGGNIGRTILKPFRGRTPTPQPTP